jgi:hypothetical protein
MAERDSTQSLLVRRKLTRSIADFVRGELTLHLATLTPQFQPHILLGDRIQGGHTESIRRAEQVFKELQTAYEIIAPAKPFSLRRELTPPFEFPRAGLEITPVEYAHPIATGSATKNIMVRCPLTWTLSYAGYPAARLPELLDPRVRGEQLQRFILSYLFLHQIVTNQRGLLPIFEALHFSITTIKTPQFGDLPITRIASNITTMRPSDAVVLESAELTGMDAFEEVANVDDLARLKDSPKERLLEIVRQQIPEFV